MTKNYNFDVIVIGSGFGGSVSSLRLAEKNYKVGLFEAGKRFEDNHFPKSNWNIFNFLFFPKLKMFGIQRLSLLKNVFILSGAGVGGGSLVYANTLYRPTEKFYQDQQWKDLADWKSELAPFYDIAEKMLGVTSHSKMTPADELFLEIAKDLGVEKTFKKTPVGVYFGEKGIEHPDPYFDGKGPVRKGCIECGECMTGCRHNAKNTLMKNYLYFAEKLGVRIIPQTTVTDIKQGTDGYIVETQSSGAWFFKNKKKYQAKKVILAAGTLETQRLLFKMKFQDFPLISDKLGELTRTNSEAILGARTFMKGHNFTQGVAITSSLFLNEHTHVEPVRYGKGHNFMGTLSTALADGDKSYRFVEWIRSFRKDFFNQVRNLNFSKWSEQSIIALVMQNLDNSITVYAKKTLFGLKLTSKQGKGGHNPTWIPEGYDFVRRLGTKMQGTSFGALNDIFNIPMTAHFLGGAVIGKDASDSVIDPEHRLHHYPDIYVVDGSAISANLGVNPSLTITAQAERAMSFWPKVE